MTKKNNFSEKFNDLQKILDGLEDDQKFDLEKNIKEYQRAQKLIEELDSILEKAKNKLIEIK